MVSAIDETTAYNQEMADNAQELLHWIEFVRQIYAPFMERYRDSGNSVVNEVELAAKTLWEI